MSDLRAVLDDIELHAYDINDECRYCDALYDEEEHQDWCPALTARDALAATPSPSSGLDVERLAEALMLARGSSRIEGRIPVLYQEQADAVAAEYARLKEQQP